VGFLYHYTLFYNTTFSMQLAQELHFIPQIELPLPAKDAQHSTAPCPLLQRNASRR
jgi:hypothetical protein